MNLYYFIINDFFENSNAPEESEQSEQISEEKKIKNSLMYIF